MEGATRTATLTALALTGFAANSLLCRLALGPRAIDASTFTLVRLAAGALVLAVLVRADPVARRTPFAGSWVSAAALFAYAILFSFAYLRIGAAVGALVLFGAVQATMIGWGLYRGERPRITEWVGLALAAGGLVALTLPGLQAPDALGAALMVGAGVAWGIYSLRGRKSAAPPVAVTAGNFLRAVPFAVGVMVVELGAVHVSARGLMLAVASGALASGLAYTLWYAALRGLSASRAAVVQLMVPPLAAVGAMLVLDEPLTLRLIGAGAAILSGVLLALRR